MKKLFIICALTALTGCSKEKTTGLTNIPQRNFFKTDAEAFRQVQQQISKFAPGEKLQSIQSISYINSRNKSFAFIFYRSNKGASNVVIRKEYVNDQEIEMTSVKCDGEYCDCKVKTIIDNAGNITLDCSCSSCTMLINKLSD